MVPDLKAQWYERQGDILAEWGGVILMDAKGAAMGLRRMGAGFAPLD